MPLSILIVEDDDLVRDAIANGLAASHRVVSTSDGSRALSLLSGDHFDVVVCDVELPGMSGRTLLRRIQREAPHTAVVMMTAFPTVDDAVATMQDGAVDFVTKPMDVNELERRVRAALPRHPAVTSQ